MNDRSTAGPVGPRNWRGQLLRARTERWARGGVELIRSGALSVPEGGAYNLIPQGDGEHDTGHRCAGEWITIEIVKEAVCFLTRAMRYDVPQQDLRISRSRMPAVPKSRFVITNVRRAH